MTIRTLHHYDRLGLLKPSRRTDAGYRLYNENDLVRLEQIIVLKFLGLPLKRIQELLDRKALELPRVLRLQRRALEEKRRQLEVAIQAIDEAEQWLSSGREPDGEIFKKVIKVIEMQNDSDWMMCYYGDAAPKSKTEGSCGRPSCKKRSANNGLNWSAISKPHSAKIRRAPRRRLWPSAGRSWWRVSQEAIARFRRG
ncbi:MAG: hypothetical protein DMG57_19745 [Acidobacteria bacterium]|nr:MAG: hypothetical protein DMG57_19745 [Acidobacteriota bacterium]